MSDLILRGLAVDAGRTVTTIPSNLRGLIAKKEDKPKQGAVTLSRLDHLITSSNTKRGATPISLLNPNSLKTKTTSNSSGNVKVTKQQLLSGLNDIKPSNRNNPTNNINSSNKSNSTTFVPTSYNFIDTDYTSEKLELAIEAIDNWERKVGSLNSLVTNANGQTGVAYKDNIVKSADKLNKARQEAINARQDAIIAYNDALKEIMSIGNTSSSKTDLYRQKYNLMETKFQDVKIKDETTMDKVKKYLNTFLDYANPFSY